MSGPKQVVCCVCHETVLKARTRHIGEGKRACLIHEGVEEKAVQAQQKIKENVAWSHKKEREKAAKIFGKSKSTSFCLEPHCPVCKKLGRPYRDFALFLLRANQILSKAGVTIFDADYMSLLRKLVEKEPELKDRVPLVFYMKDKMPLSVWQHAIEVMDKMEPGSGMVFEMIGGLQICPTCADKLNVQFQYPEIDLDKLMVFAAISQSLDDVASAMQNNIAENN
jgi:hypothetical protein